ncbi:MAG: hypothetical protein R6W84_12465 [Promethearchaeia archaeon]
MLKNTEKNKIQIPIVFIGKPQWEAGWPYLGFDNNEFVDSITNHIQNKFPEINFLQNEIITTYNEELIEKIKNDLSIADGLLIYTIGHYGDPGIIRAGLEIINHKKMPCILANLIYAGDHTFIKIYTSIKDKKNYVCPISSENFEDFDKYLKILFNIILLKGEKLLVFASDKRERNWEQITNLVTPERKKILENYPEYFNQASKMRDEDFEFFIDLEGRDQAHPWRKNPNDYKEGLLNTFGVELIREDPDKILYYYDKVDEKKAESIANKWIKNAEFVEPSKKSIVNSAKLYLALKTLLEDLNCNFFAPDCGTLLLLGKMPAYPCMAFFELSKDNVYGICESDTNSAISFMLGLYIANKPGFVSNHTLDLINNRITYLHCVAPCNLEGEGKSSLKYDLVYHGESNLIGVSPRVKFPKNKTVTTIKVSVSKNKIAIRKGKIIDNVEKKGGCVSKMLVEGNAKKILENYDWESFGWHRVTFLGDLLQDFQIGAKLLGLKIIQEDV